MAPAPMKRTSLRQMPVTKLARSPCIGVIAVMMGTAPAQAISDAQQHGEADGNSHQMARAHQRQGKRECCSRSPPRRRSEEALHPIGGQPHGDRDGQTRGRKRAIDHRQQALARFGIFGAHVGAHFEHFGSRHAFGIGKVGLRDQGAAQREW